jgi:hypothetical protein
MTGENGRKSLYARRASAFKQECLAGLEAAEDMAAEPGSTPARALSIGSGQLKECYTQYGT